MGVDGKIALAAAPGPPVRRDLPLKEHEYRRIRDLMQQHFGLHLSAEKKTLISNRLSHDVVSKGFLSYQAYLEAVEADSTGVALDHLASLIVTHHTAFFREAMHFGYLKTKVLPDIDGQLQRTQDPDLRIWCAAAATGEEAYSLMITLLEHFGTRYASLDAGLLATDISTRALSKARRGVYTAEQVRVVSALLRQRYFRQMSQQQYEVLPRVREEVVFRKFNLMTRRYPFKKPFHIIFCRNVMIYFDAATRRQLVHKLYDVTAPGGYLFIGHAETIDRQDRRYAYVRPAVYRKLQ
jgi:chemotaxis protein methyltransferase CheR